MNYLEISKCILDSVYNILENIECFILFYF